MKATIEDCKKLREMLIEAGFSPDFRLPRKGKRLVLCKAGCNVALIVNNVAGVFVVEAMPV